MSKATIDRATKEYADRYAALQIKVAEHMGKQGDGLYETPLPADLRAEMDELGVDFGDKGALVDKSGKAIVFEDKEPGGLGNDEAPSAPVLDTKIATEQELDDAIEMDKAVSANSNPAQNKDSYLQLMDAVNKYSAGSMSLADLLAVMNDLGANNTQSPFQAHLVCVKAAVNHPNKEEGKAALDVVNKNFAFLGDETSKQGLLETVTAAKNISESDKVPHAVKLEVEQGIADLEVEIDDKSPQQEQSDEKSEGEKKDVKKEAIAKEKSKGNKLNIAKKTAKYGAALGLAVGFPPFGLIAAVALLALASSWGEAKKDSEEEKLSELEKNQGLLKAAKQRLADAKSKRLAGVEQPGEEKEDEGLGDEEPENQKKPVLETEAEAENQDDQPPAATKAHAALNNVAQDAQNDVKKSESELGNVGKDGKGNDAPALDIEDEAQQRNHQQENADALAQEQREELENGKENGGTGYIDVSAAENLDEKDTEGKDLKVNKPVAKEPQSAGAAQDELEDIPGSEGEGGYIDVEADLKENGDNSVDPEPLDTQALAKKLVSTANNEAAQEKEKADSQLAEVVSEVKKEGGISQ